MTDSDNRTGRFFIRGALIAVMVVGLVAGPDVVRAQSPSPTPSNPASIVVFKLEGDAGSGKLRTELTSAMREQVQGNSRYQLVNNNPVVLSDVVVVLGCDSPSTTCLGKAADHFGADYLIFGKFESDEGRNRVSVRLFDPGRGRYVRSFGRVIEKLSPPYESFREEVDSLLRTDQQRERQKVTSLTVSSNVEDAKVRLDGQLVGKTPMERRGISPGKYKVEVTHEGYQPWETVVQLGAGNSVNLQASLDEKPEASTTSEPTASASPSGTESSSSSVAPTDEGSADPPADPPPSAHKARTAQWGPWITIGMGAAALIGGGVQGLRSQEKQEDLEKLRDKYDGNVPDEEKQREQNLVSTGQNATVAANILFVSGGAMAAGGLLWLILRGPNQGPQAAVSGDRHWSVSVTGNGIQASWRW